MTQEGKTQQHSKRPRPRSILGVAVPGEAVSSTRPRRDVPRGTKSAAAEQCSVNETDATQQRSVQEALDTFAHGLSQRRKSYGSEPRARAGDRRPQERRQVLLRLDRKDSTDSADRSISKVRKLSSGTR